MKHQPSLLRGDALGLSCKLLANSRWRQLTEILFQRDPGPVISGSFVWRRRPRERFLFRSHVHFGAEHAVRPRPPFSIRILRSWRRSLLCTIGRVVVEAL